MCSKYASEEEGLLETEGRRFFYNSTFSGDALPERRPEATGDSCTGPLLSSQEKASFVDYLFDGFLQESRIQGRCGSCWAYALSGCIQYATSLAYRRLNGCFNNRYMAHQLILSCMQVEGMACGCFGGDLAGAMGLIAQEGIVTFRQFPYENDSSVVTKEGQLHYICRENEGKKGYLGTCAPCKVHEPDLERVVPKVEGIGNTATAFVTLTSCMPCNSTGPPVYFPLKPCRLYLPEQSLEDNVDAVKRALRFHGPISATIKINTADFSRMRESKLITDLSKVEIYKPLSTPPSGSLHSVLIIGYLDPWAVSKSDRDRVRSAFVCRNSWGDNWGFRIKTRQIVQRPEGGQESQPIELGGFFMISMYESFKEIGLLETCIGIQGIQIRSIGDTAPRDLMLTDPFVVPFQPGFLESFLDKKPVIEAGSILEKTDSSLQIAPPLASSSGGRTPWSPPLWVLFLALVVFVLLSLLLTVLLVG